MFDSTYIWFSSVGLWFGLGFIQAVAVAFAILYIVGKLVNWAFGLFGDVDSVNQYTFTELPEFYDSMTLNYNSKTKVITATAQYRHGNSTHTMSTSATLKPKHSIQEDAEELQLSLMQTIASSIK